MANSNGATTKWIIALSISIIMGFSGWTFAGINGARVKQVEGRAIEIKRNTEEISLLKAQNGIIITKLEFLQVMMAELKVLMKE